MFCSCCSSLWAVLLMLFATTVLVLPVHHYKLNAVLTKKEGYCQFKVSFLKKKVMHKVYIPLMVHKKITLLICLKLAYFHFIFLLLPFSFCTIELCHFCHYCSLQHPLLFFLSVFLNVFSILSFFQICYLWFGPRNLDYSNAIWLWVLDFMFPSSDSAVAWNCFISLWVRTLFPAGSHCKYSYFRWFSKGQFVHYYT